MNQKMSFRERMLRFMQGRYGVDQLSTCFIWTGVVIALMAMFMKNPGTIYTKVQIYENISGEYFESDDNTIMVHISNLRDKIEDNPKDPCYIKTIRGVGYKIENR